MNHKTQEEVAEAFNLSVATISRHENGSRGLDRAMINAYARYYNVKPYELFIPGSKYIARRQVSV